MMREAEQCKFEVDMAHLERISGLLTGVFTFCQVLKVLLIPLFLVMPGSIKMVMPTYLA